jgi:hypothetical protein
LRNACKCTLHETYQSCLYFTSHRHIPYRLSLRLYSKCLDVFWHQLSSWLLHGLLTDPYREFFIQHTPTTQPSTQMQVYAKFVEFSRSFDESPVGGDSSSGCADWYILLIRVRHHLVTFISCFVLGITQVVWVQFASELFATICAVLRHGQHVSIHR